MTRSEIVRLDFDFAALRKCILVNLKYEEEQNIYSLEQREK